MRITDELWQRIDAIPGWMGRRECEWLANLASTVTSWTEVGTYAGRSFVAVGLFLPRNSRIQVVDVAFQREFQVTKEWVKEQRPDLQIIEIHASSLEASQAALDTDVVFIDADHTYRSVVEDIYAWHTKCKILCGHDYQPHWAGVVKAVDELCPGATNPVDDIWVRP